jgi:hypothetical protein
MCKQAGRFSTWIGFDLQDVSQICECMEGGEQSLN